MNLKNLLLASLLALGITSSVQAQAADYQSSVTGVNGYDVVSYHNSKRPIRGNGHYLAVHNGVTYLFANKENLETFQETPDHFVPAYGGYCAFGVSDGKKFVGDPEVWRIVDDKVYLNLDARIQAEWLKDVPGKIDVANANWVKIRDKAPADL